MLEKKNETDNILVEDIENTEIGRFMQIMTSGRQSVSYKGKVCSAMMYSHPEIKAIVVPRD